VDVCGGAPVGGNSTERRHGILGLALAALLVGSAACGDDAPSSGTEAAVPTITGPRPVTSASSELCSAREELRGSVADVSEVDVVEDGTTALTEAVARIKDDLRAVTSAAGSNVETQVDALQVALDRFSTAVATSDTPVSEVAATTRDVAESGATLLTSLANIECS
jgi:hypothetical protein